MIDVTSEEFRKTVRHDSVFDNPLIRAGIVHVACEPFETTLKCRRYQTWDCERLNAQTGMSTKAAAYRISQYVSRTLTNFFSSVFVGVAGSQPLPHDKAERDKYRLAQVELFKQASKDNDHPIALVPSVLKTYLAKQAVLSYHLCPFTQQSLPSYEGKLLVHDDSCVQPYLFYPGEVKVFFSVPDVEVKIDSENSSVFSYFWNYDVAVNGFEYTEALNPANNYVDTPDLWKKTGTSRIVRVS